MIAIKCIYKPSALSNWIYHFVHLSQRKYQMIYSLSVTCVTLGRARTEGRVGQALVNSMNVGAPLASTARSASTR